MSHPKGLFGFMGAPCGKWASNFSILLSDRNFARHIYNSMNSLAEFRSNIDMWTPVHMEFIDTHANTHHTHTIHTPYTQRILWFIWRWTDPFAISKVRIFWCLWDVWSSTAQRSCPWPPKSSAAFACGSAKFHVSKARLCERVRCRPRLYDRITRFVWGGIAGSK